ncbi:MAG: cytochrome b/b6 domain-containing protein [Gammaproteobacteria bacterium]|nr:cytochrome b/b6 domain-containing protein [Gammaproteobacteria bacterium]
MTNLKAYFVWDANIRWFHWINLLCVLGLIAVGVAILNGKALGVSTEGKILLKTVHVWIGYVFAVNLLWRLIWAFIGGQYARWRAILPGGHGYMNELRSYLADIKAGRPRQYLGHNPVGRIAVTLLLFLLLVQAVTGLVLAGTDLFYPPIGSWIAAWVANPGVDPATLAPYAKETYDAVAYEAMRAFRKPFITIHYYGFYVLLGLILVHILAVVMTELREGGNLISAMFTGKKVLNKAPADLTKTD